METGHSKLDYNYIVNGIYVGTNMCCRVHFDERLANQGIAADISLEAERIDVPFGASYYLWLPVVDRHAPTIEQLVVGVGVLNDLVKLGIKVYVHCKNGHGRAPTLVAAYLIRQGKSATEAEKFLLEKRSAVHLQLVQREILKQWESRNISDAVVQ